jgi:hypothetical protein
MVCNSTLLILDKLEENIPLNPPERNFRNILKDFIQKLVQQQKEYWKERYIVRWTKQGNHSTKFFHAATTKRYRLSTITSLTSEDGRIISDHTEKAALLWNEYRSRLGHIVNTVMHFDLLNLVQQHNLQQIEVSFTKDDIDKVVMKMPPDKAPGPDGFNSLFIKKC